LSEEAISFGYFRVSMARKQDHEFLVDEDRCFGCAACIALCPVDALELIQNLAIVDEPTCTHCEHCLAGCPVHALSIKEVK